MKQRLKKERRKLFRRIILIMMGFWLIASVLFCAVRLDLEKTFIEKDENSELQTIVKLMMEDVNTKRDFRSSLPTYISFFYANKSKQEAINSQLIFSDNSTGEIYLNTADKIAEEYSYRYSVEVISAFDEIDKFSTSSADETDKNSTTTANVSPIHYIALLDYGQIRYALTDTQLQEIESFLNKQEDGNYYELICTKLQINDFGVTTPLELKIVEVDGKDPAHLIDNDVKTYSLDVNYQVYRAIQENNNEANRNIIPKEFLFDGERNPDYIGSLTKEDRENDSELFQLDRFDYLYYAKDTVTQFFNSVEEPDAKWTVEYARKINLMENCRSDLLLGIVISFSFFLILSGFLFLVIWTTVQTELLLEQRRLELTNALAHDVKTPLFVISGYGYTLKEDIDEKERDLYLQKIIEQTDEANSLVHRMLDFSKLDSYKITLHKTKFDLRELTEAVLQNYAVLSDNKTIVLTHSGDNTVNADKELIKTAVQNLTDNAVKYAFPDSEIRINLSGKTFSISNQTEPLTKDELKELQMPYMRKDKSRSQKGNGLGLSIVKSILELHDAPFDIKMKDTTLTCSFTLKTKKSRRSV